MPLTAFFVRHGESRANVERIFANRVDHPFDLTETGRAQARELAAILGDRCITHIYTSPLPRARQTAGVIGNTLGLPVEITDALREYDVGEFEGLPYGGVHVWRWDEHARVERAWREGDRHARHPGGESLDDIAARFMPFMSRLPATRAPSDRVAIVGHGGLYLAALPELFGSVSLADALGFGLGHGEMVTATFDAGRWTCLKWGEHRLV